MLRSEEEERTLGLLDQFHYIVFSKWRLQRDTNLQFEFLAAFHVLQGFVISHMLQRLEPDNWGQWYEEMVAGVGEAMGGRSGEVDDSGPSEET